MKISLNKYISPIQKVFLEEVLSYPYAGGKRENRGKEGIPSFCKDELEEIFK